MHVVKQLPAILLWQTAGERPPQYDFEVPIVRSHFSVQLLYDGIGAGVRINLAFAIDADDMLAVALFALI